ncbi:MAG: DNA methyltransferase [Rhodobacteraceae bacterium]|nr:DNA methyltransferase [Paracoccaceae bacterium]
MRTQIRPFVEPIPRAKKSSSTNVFSKERSLEAPELELVEDLVPNARLKMEGREFLSLLPQDSVPVVFFDPQYRGVLEKLKFGNEGKTRGRRRFALAQMSEGMIAQFLTAIDRVLIPSGHLFLWLDKFHLCSGVAHWFTNTKLETVDLVTWDKGTIGMGYRTRRRAEYCLVAQKIPRRAKGIWTIHNIPDVYKERPFDKKEHPHSKPVELQGQLLSAVSHRGDYVVDPAAGSFSVMQAAINYDRNFLGCDLNG